MRAAAPWPEEDAVPAGLPDFNLGELVRRGIEPPELICGGMLYPGGVHSVAGQPGGGKTTLTAWWMLQYIRGGGHVMLLDEESGPEMMGEKFIDLGAAPDELEPPRFNYVPFPSRAWNLADLLQLRERIAERQPGIIVFDSAAEFLSLAGVDEDSGTQTTAFWKRVLKPCARDFGAAVIAIDHTGKGNAAAGYGRGSGGKKAASDVLFMIETVSPFNRQQDGLLRLTTSPGKDRRGWLARCWDIHVRAGKPLTLDITETDGDARSATREMPPAKAKLLEALTAIGAVAAPVTSGELVDWIAAAHGHGLTRPTVSKYLNELSRDGRADHIDPGPQQARLWFATPETAAGVSPQDDGTTAWPAGSIGAEAAS
jgi:hypothetical protein